MSWQVRVRPDGVDKGPIMRVGFLVLAAIWSALALVWLIFASRITLEMRLFQVAFNGFIALVVGRFSSCGVRLSPDGVLVRNPLRTHRIPWQQFVEFDLDRWGWYPDVGVVRRAGAKPTYVSALSTMGPFGLFGNDEAVPDAVADLNRLAAPFVEALRDRPQHVQR